jgi:hypothetical protein
MTSFLLIVLGVSVCLLDAEGFTIVILCAAAGILCPAPVKALIEGDAFSAWPGASWPRNRPALAFTCTWSCWLVGHSIVKEQMGRLMTCDFAKKSFHNRREALVFPSGNEPNASI